MFEFQAIPAWFGIEMVLLTLLRLYRREMSVRAYYVERGENKEIYKDTFVEGRDGWIVPKTTGSGTWAYEFLDREGLVPPRDAGG